MSGVTSLGAAGAAFGAVRKTSLTWWVRSVSSEATRLCSDHESRGRATRTSVVPAGFRRVHTDAAALHDPELAGDVRLRERADQRQDEIHEIPRRRSVRKAENGNACVFFGLEPDRV